MSLQRLLVRAMELIWRLGRLYMRGRSATRRHFGVLLRIFPGLSGKPRRQELGRSRRPEKCAAPSGFRVRRLILRKI